MLLKLFTSFVLPALCCHAAAVGARNAHCEAISFTYTVTSTIKDVSPPPNLSAPGAVSAYQPVLAQKYLSAPSINRKGTYTLSGWYCRAPTGGKSGFPLQVLAHGSTYTKEYWNRGAWGNLAIANSWQLFASHHGYSTLAIDRLCNGASSHPDPQLDCQLSTSIEAFHALFLALRSGKASNKIPKPTELAFAGHSAGSITVSNHVQTYPGDIDTAILTGWPSGPIAGIGAAAYRAEHHLTPPAPSVFVPNYLPAYLADPARFSGLNQGYIASTNASFRRVFYAGDYDPIYPYLDHRSRGSSPLGEQSYTGVMSFSAFRGKVMIVTGDLDSAAWADGDVIRRSRSRFPSASKFHWVHARRSGHDVNYHRSAQQTYRNVFEKLAEWEGRNSA